MDPTIEAFKLPELQLSFAVGFQGNIENGLRTHPDLSHIIYAIGQIVVIKNVTNDKEQYLHGHTREISCLAISKDGKYIASGQTSHVGFNAEVIIWTFHERKVYGSYLFHKVKVGAVAFSCEGNFVLSLGGEDCRSIVVWSINAKEILCRTLTSTAAENYPTQITCGRANELMFVTAGRNILQLWKIDTSVKKLVSQNVSLKNSNRDFLSIALEPNDDYLYCGTTTGDIFKYSLDLKVSENVNYVYRLTKSCPFPGTIAAENHLPFSPFYKLGVTVICLLKSQEFVIGTGEGLVIHCREIMPQESQQFLHKIGQTTNTFTEGNKSKPGLKLQEINSINLKAPITSISLRGQGRQIFVGTSKCEIYRLTLSEFESECLHASHNAPIQNVQFSDKSANFFITSSENDIRLWKTKTSRQIAYIFVENVLCTSLYLSKDGEHILSGWNDGAIRVHEVILKEEAGDPMQLNLKFNIDNAHTQSTTALAQTTNSLHIVSGGGDGKIRIWNATENSRALCATLKGHKNTVTCIKLRSDDKQCVSTGSDGRCIIWDLQHFAQLRAIYAYTVFKNVCYDFNEEQVLTCGTDHKICSWNILDGSQAHSINGSETGAVNTLSISKDGKNFISGGFDKIVKFWDYSDMYVTHVGLGHCAEITNIAISPIFDCIISVDNRGSIFIWRYPIED